MGRSKSAFLSSGAPAVAGPAKANLADFKKHIAPVLNKACVTCHGPKQAKGDFRIDELDPNLLKGDDVKWWLEVLDAVTNGEMPPENATLKLADAEVSKVTEWLGQEIQKASKTRTNEGSHSSFRRMSRYEYNYALQDLLGLPYDFASSLPPETASEDGFKNSSEMLQMSAIQFATYRQIALEALRKATVRGERPKPVTYIISMQEEMEKVAGQKDKSIKRGRGNRNRQQLLNQETGEGFRFSGGSPKPKPKAVPGKTPAASAVALVLPRSNELKLNLDRFLPDEGTMRVRIRAGRTTMKADEYASLRLTFGAHTSNNANFSQVVSRRDIPVTAPASKPQFVHFDIPLSEIPRNPFRKLATTFPRRDELLSIRNISNAHHKDERLNVHVDYIEISAPHYDQWPPKTHTDIFVDGNVKGDEQKYGLQVLTRFMERALATSCHFS